MKRSKFNLSHTQLLTMKMGQLVPCGLQEVLPGDSFQHTMAVLARALPLQTPPMHRCHIKVEHWFVPHRLVWEDWEKFITGGPDGMDASVFPTVDFTGAAPAAGSLADYLNVPVGFQGEVSALPFRAYSLIYNEWYRDQDLVTALTIDKTSGADTTTNRTLQYRAWGKDYFTTCRPWEQKGPAVTLPLGTTAPVVNTGSRLMLAEDAAGTVGLTGVDRAAAGAGASLQAEGAGTGVGANMFYASGLQTDLSGATSIDVNTVREAFALQRFEEARARYGSRYTEYLAYLGVRSSDARLQRPEYLGGGSDLISFSEVLQTGSTTADANGVGQLYGHGIASMRSNAYRRFFEEHGYVLSFISVLPETMYPDGLPRTLNRRVKEDFFQKELQHIGQQPVLMKEVYALGANPNSVFGYQDRYDEYRFQESRVHGAFLSTMNDWHFARLLAAEPAINSAFVSSADVTQRPFQDTSGPSLAVQCRHRLAARRLLAPRGSSFIF